VKTPVNSTRRKWTVTTNIPIPCASSLRCFFHLCKYCYPQDSCILSEAISPIMRTTRFITDMLRFHIAYLGQHPRKPGLEFISECGWGWMETNRNCFCPWTCFNVSRSTHEKRTMESNHRFLVLVHFILLPKTPKPIYLKHKNLLLIVKS
jgi:hypothetical protein